MAGASLAYQAARAGLKPLLVERETSPGYHATGRSAATFIKSYGNAVVRELTCRSESFYRAPPEGFHDAPLLAPRGLMLLAREEQTPRLEEELLAARRFVPGCRIVDMEEARELVPLLRPDPFAAALLDPEACDLDVDAILQGYVRGMRAAGGTVRTGTELVAAERRSGVWRLWFGREQAESPVLVNAAGAWADRVASMAGLPPLGLTPMRRTAFLIDAPDGVDVRRWPLVADLAETFYLKPDAGRLLCSPADETPSPPTDAAAEEWDVAVAAARIQDAFEIEIRTIRHRWAGLRTFAPDRTPVLGFDPRTEGFFWLAGQGGYGIQTAPAMAALALRSIMGTGRREDALAPALDPARLLS